MKIRTPSLCRVLAVVLCTGTCLTGWSQARAQEACQPCGVEAASCDPCGGEQLNTAVTWLKDPNRALRLARQQGKLLFVIQVSGNFARSEFT